MRLPDSHLSDRQILLALDRELSAGDAEAFRAHLDTCDRCRSRLQELEGAMEWAARMRLKVPVPPAAGSRALLKAELAHLGQDGIVLPNRLAWVFAAAATIVVLVSGLFFVHSGAPSATIVSLPDSHLTPGATVLVNRRAVCAESNANNKPVSAALRRKVFEEYGITGAASRAYEVDYLVTPALGGADDIHNLWPHSYTSTIWNAQVKDRLEERMREMVCDGQLDLSEAQEEIASNWIAAYKKYFHTDKPIDGR